ncbi:ferritin-like domain-containing protein [Tissierella sp.]|uniref:ferritin-like domain-containing protein n=1 Tax=Tissierella sp. TaxID=41274 RepID=UPI002854AF88|nr:ferritin-like domain-containing protein [Tissierella sp.]MDR7856666.1 ferritin-like domain-containing protein [Tissierella sp.]
MLPLLGCHRIPQITELVYDAIVDEATAAEFYGRLLQEAPNDLHREFIRDAMEDELNHLQKFTTLYCYLTGYMPQYVITPIVYPNYKEGILMALKDELDAASFYRDVQLSTTDLFVRDTFYYAMVEELEHATRFSTLYNTL